MSYLADHWSFDPFLITAAVVVALHEAGLANLRRRSVPSHTRTRRLRSLFFYGGVALLVLTVMSPIDYWSDDYFFVHMVEHLLDRVLRSDPHRGRCALAAAPPRPSGPVQAAPRQGSPARALLGRAAVRRTLGDQPLDCVDLLQRVMVLWHVPTLFDSAQENQAVHVWLMHASLFATGVLFWLQIIPSYPFG